MSNFWANDPVVNSGAPPTPFYANDPIVGDNSQSSTTQAPASPATGDTLSGIASQVPAGLNQFAYDVMGAPVDLSRSLINAVTSPTREAQSGAEQQGKGAGSGFSIPEIPDNTPGSSNWWADVFHNVAGTTRPQDIPVNGPWERAVRTGVNVGATAAIPESAFGKVGELLGAGEKAGAGVGSMLGAPATLGQAARTAATGTAAGMAGQAAQEAPIPDWAKPYAAIGAGTLGGLGVEGAISGVKSSIAPFYGAGREAVIGAKLVDAARNPDAATSALSASDIVPGSKLTTFQKTGDIGLGELERGVATKNPGAFTERAAEQNMARLAALKSPQEEGYPELVADTIRNNFANMNADTDSAVANAQSTARQAASDIGTPQPPEEIGTQIQSDIQPQMNAAQASARQALEAEAPMQTARSIGESAQNELQAEQDAARAKQDVIWKAIDPQMQVVTSPLKRVAQSVYGDMSPEEALTLTPIERGLAGAINDWGSSLPLGRMLALRKVVSTTMRAMQSPLQPNDTAYARLIQLRGAIENTIADTAQGAAANEQQQLASGAISPESTILGRVKQEMEGWNAGEGTAAGTVSANGNGEPVAGRTATVSGAPGAEVPPQSGPANAIGDQGGEGIAGTPVDAGTAQKLTDATQSYKEYKQKFKPIQSLIKRAGKTYPYDMPPETAGESLWQQGGKGAAMVRNVTSVAPKAVEDIRAAAAQSLRQQAPDGILTPQKWVQWRTRYNEPLQELEKASPGSIERFERAANAAAPLGRFKDVGLDKNPAAVPDRFFPKGPAGFSAVNDLRGLVGKDRADELLRAHAADSLSRAALQDDGTIDAAKLSAWRKQHADALRAMPELSASMDNAADAATHLSNIVRVRKEAIDGFQKTAAAKIMGLSDPSDITKTVGSILGQKDAVKNMQHLSAEIGDNQEARDGMRKSIVDYMTQRLVSNTEAATSGANTIKADQFQSFIGKNHAALRPFFSDEELDGWKAIARDIKVAKRSQNAVRIPGQSNTAQDIMATKKHELAPSLLHVAGHAFGRLVLPGAGLYLGEGHGMMGAIGGIGAGLALNALGALRSSGIDKMEQLLVDAMLNPEVAKRLMAKAPRTGRGVAAALTRALRSGTTTYATGKQ